MTYAICNLSIVNLKFEPSHRSETASQVLFGESFEVLETAYDWIKIRLDFDGYEGWILQSQCAKLEFDDYKQLKKEEICISYDLVQIATHGNEICSIVIGSSLPFYKDQYCVIGNLKYNFDGNARYPERMESSNTLIENAYMYLNCPYMWGGRSPFGIDCSGYTQMVYKLSGMKLRRDASQQSEQGTLVNLLDEAQPGDLAFFDNPEGKITHVGIIIGDNNIIHASGRVRLDTIDHVGIYNTDIKKYSHNLRLIKRFL
ncbi:MAG: NlpC/P60 family protein [Bacteroidia bacterium]